MNFTFEASINSTAVPHTLLPLRIVDMCVHGINFLLGFPTHSYIVWLIVTGTGSGVASEFFNLNLSVCELLFSFNCMLSVLSSVVQSLSTLPSFLNGITITAQPVFQCLICVERYLAVVHPVTFLKYKPLRYRLICCTAAWVITLGSCLFCMLKALLFIFNALTWYYSIQCLLLLCIELFCLVAVLRALKQSGPGDRRREIEENRMKRRAFYLILINTVSMSIMFVPFISAGFFSIFIQINSDYYKSLGFTCYVLGSFVHPVLFLHRTGKLSFTCLS